MDHPNFKPANEQLVAGEFKNSPQGLKPTLILLNLRHD
jgi:hypothetical protein